MTLEANRIFFFKNFFSLYAVGICSDAIENIPLKIPLCWHQYISPLGKVNLVVKFCLIVGKKPNDI